MASRLFQRGNLWKPILQQQQNYVRNNILKRGEATLNKQENEVSIYYIFTLVNTMNIYLYVPQQQ